MEKKRNLIAEVKGQLNGLRNKNRQLNVIIGVDVDNYNLKIMRVEGHDIASAKVDFIPVEQELVVRGEWARIMTETLPEYIEAQNFATTFAVWLVLPDRTVGTDVLTIPTLNKSKMATALETQMSELYRFYSGYKFNKLLLTSNKTNSTFEICMVNKELLNSVYKALSECKLYVRNCTYAASCAVNAVFALRPKNRKASFLFLDIKADTAKYSVCVGGITVGWKSLPFGYNILLSEKVLVEGNLYNNDIAQIAVLNAVEKAKQKKLTVLDEEDDAAIIEEEAISVNELTAAPENLSEEALEQARHAAEGPEEELRSADAQAAAAEVRQAESASGAIVQAPRQKTYVRKTKKLPAFMQRPVPETREGIAAENFRIFVKYALLLKQQNEQSGYLAAPQYVLVNMPAEYGYLIERINAEDSGLEFRWFDPAREDNTQLTGNLDLYGALFMDNFNRQNNF